MGRSKTLFQLQEFDTDLDNAAKRITEIDIILGDRAELDAAILNQQKASNVLLEKQKFLASTERAVEDHTLKIDQNQKKLYSGAITNPKELEDLQLESTSLNKYLSVLEERQLEAMLETEGAKDIYNQASANIEALTKKREEIHSSLYSEKGQLETSIVSIDHKKASFLNSTSIPDLPTYQSLRKTSGNIAVTLMTTDSCSSCGANIPSAIAQEARSPVKLAFCPTCKRILHQVV